MTYDPRDFGFSEEQAAAKLAAITPCRCGRAVQCYSAYTWCPPWRPGEWRLGMSEAEAGDTEALARGRAVPHHMGACAAASCWHGMLWHERRGGHPRGPCTRPGCPCEGYATPERQAS